MAVDRNQLVMLALRRMEGKWGERTPWRQEEADALYHELLFGKLDLNKSA